MAGKKGSKKKKAQKGTSVVPSFPAINLPSWAESLFLVLAILLVLGVVYQGALTGNLVFLSSDSENALSFSSVGDKALSEDGYPLWNPYLFAGMPSFGSVSYLKYVYPPTEIFNTLQNWGFPPLTWMFGHLLFGGLGMVWLLSRWKLPFPALLLGALVFLLFPKVVAWGVHGHGSKLGAAMYMPWIVASVWRVLDGKGWRSVGLTALFLGLLLLRGHPQISYYTLALVAWFSLWNAVWPLDEKARQMVAKLRWLRVGQVFLGLAVGFLIAAVLLVPVHKYSDISIRGQNSVDDGDSGLEYATGWSQAPNEYGTAVLPMAAGFGKATYLGRMPFNDYPNYFGFLLLSLVASVFLTTHRSLLLALLTMSMLAVFVSFGNFGFGFYEWLYGWLPFFDKFRIPSMILILPAFAAAVLAPLGAARLAGIMKTGSLSHTAGQGNQQTFNKIFPMVLAGLGFLLLMGSLTGMAEGIYQSSLESLAKSAGKPAPQILLKESWLLHKSSLMLIGLILITAGAAIWGSTRARMLSGVGLLWVLLLLVVVDLSAVDKLIVGPDNGLHVVVQNPQGQAQLVPSGKLLRPYRPSKSKSGPGAVTLKKLVGHDRVFPLGMGSNQNLWMGDGIRSLGGYHAVKLAAYEQIRKRLYSEKPAVRLASWLSAGVVSFDGEFTPGQLQVLASLGGDLEKASGGIARPVFYRNSNAVPRARLLTQWANVSTLPEKDALQPFLDGIQTGEIDVFNQVFLAEEPSPMPANSLQPLPVPIFEKDGLGEIILSVNSPVPALLLLSDMMAPGWQVEVDGQTQPILTADLVLRAVALESGSHKVRFHYSDPSVRQGLTLSVVGWILTLIMLLSPLFLGRRANPSEGNNQS
ncbi:MAG: YfhO family protein [bacterium]|nr:YfhO family protein [bacterium]